MHQNTIKMTIGEQISIQRKRKGMTQETLSEISGISLRTVQRIESDKSVPRAFTLKILADSLELDVSKMTELCDIPKTFISESHSYPLAQRMNFAGLSVILIPVLPILIMLSVWMKNRTYQTSCITEKRIISFQIIWLTLTFFVLFITKILYYYLTGSHANGNISPLLPAYLLMLTFNFVVVIYSALKLQKKELGIFYRLTPAFF
jgi:transcriptional regulator with XRE-family HTH domain